MTYISRYNTDIDRSNNQSVVQVLNLRICGNECMSLKSLHITDEMPGLCIPDLDISPNEMAQNANFYKIADISKT